MLDRQLDLALEGSNSLNARGTTLVGFLGTTIALVANASLMVVGEVDQLPLGYLIALGVSFTVALTTLGGCVVFALAAVRPNGSSSVQLQKVAMELKHGRFNGDRVRHLTREALYAQHDANDSKSARMRWAYALAGTGIVAVVLAIAFYCAASRVG